MAHIPIVDFAKTTTGTEEEKEHVAKQIDDAFRTAGFVYLKNHGVPLDKVRGCFEWVNSPNHRIPSETSS
jgi:isopenicillin N synthase-like dioxygenase